MDYQKLWEHMMGFFETTKKASWGKIEIQDLMKDLEINMARNQKSGEGGKDGK